MKKKLTVNKLALGNLKTRKKQYTVMIIGMIFAMVFLSGILFLFSSLNSSLKHALAENYGNANAVWMNIDEKTVNEALENKIIRDAGYAHLIGYAFTENDGEGSPVAWLDENAMELANPVLSEGVFPTKENEIAIESAVLSSMNIKAKVGDKITLNFKVQNGTTTFDEAIEKTYTLVGILKNKRSNIASWHGIIDKEPFPAAFVAPNTKTELGGKEALTVYLTIPDTKQAYIKYENFSASVVGYDNTVEIYRDLALSDTDDARVTIAFVAIIVAVLAGISCLSVISAFSANLKERKKQIGLLRAVGATKRQIVNIFGREAFIISLIVTPVSVLISYFAVKGIIKLLGEDIVFVPDWRVLILCAVFNVLCVMLAALIPLVSASRISPMQSIRNIETARKMRKKKIKSKTDFDVSSLISKRAMTFSKLKQIVVSVILAASIFVSCFVFSWYTHNKDLLSHIDADYELHLARDDGLGYVNYDTKNNGFSENDRQEILSNYYVDRVTGTKIGSVNMFVPFTTSDYRKLVSGNYELDLPVADVQNTQEQAELERSVTSENFEEVYITLLYKNYSELQSKAGYGEYIPLTIVALDEKKIAGLDEYVYDGKINIEKLNSGEEIILVAPKQVGVFFDDGKYGGLYTCYNDIVDDYEDTEECKLIFKAKSDFKAGEKVTLSALSAKEPDKLSLLPNEYDRNDKDTVIGAVVSEAYGMSYFHYGREVSVITTVKGLDNFVKNRSYKELKVFLNTECNDDIDSEMQSLIKEVTDTVGGSAFTSEYDFQKEQKTDINRLLIAGASVAFLFFAACIAIINNTITTSIRESKTKIGTLRAVGATRSELVKIYVKELLSMLLWGVIIGFATFTIGYFVVPILVGEELDITYNPLGAILFCIITFVVCILNLYLKIRAEMKRSIIDNIREL